MKNNIMKNNMIKESKYDTNSLPFAMLYSDKYAIEHGNEIVKDCGYYGSILVEMTESRKIYGILFKETGYESGVTGMKCFIYDYLNQNLTGMLDGKTFFSSDKNFQEDIKKYLV